MTTRWLRADRITCADAVVTGGETNPLQAGERRRAWKVCEATTAEGKTHLRLVRRANGNGNGADAWLAVAVGAGERLKVMT